VVRSNASVEQSRGLWRHEELQWPTSSAENAWGRETERDEDIGEAELSILNGECGVEPPGALRAPLASAGARRCSRRLAQRPRRIAPSQRIPAKPTSNKSTLSNTMAGAAVKNKTPPSRLDGLSFSSSLRAGPVTV